MQSEVMRLNISIDLFLSCIVLAYEARGRASDADGDQADL